MQPDDVVDVLLQGAGPTTDAAALAWVCGLELRPQRGGEARLDGATLRYDGTAERAEQQRAIAQCVALWACIAYGVSATSVNVDYIARAIVA